MDAVKVSAAVCVRRGGAVECAITGGDPEDRVCGCATQWRRSRAPRERGAGRPLGCQHGWSRVQGESRCVSSVGRGDVPLYLMEHAARKSP